MHQALTGVRNVVAAALLPVITPLVLQFKAWLVTNREWLKVNITGAINSIADAIKSINWTAVLAGFQKFGQWLEWGVQLIGGWENAFIAFIALMNGALIASLLNVGLVLAKLAASGAHQPDRPGDRRDRPGRVPDLSTLGRHRRVFHRIVGRGQSRVLGDARLAARPATASHSAP